MQKLNLKVNETKNAVARPEGGKFLWYSFGSGQGPWYLARSAALCIGLSNEYFHSLELPTLIDGCSVTNSNCRVRARAHGGGAGVTV